MTEAVESSNGFAARSKAVGEDDSDVDVLSHWQRVPVSLAAGGIGPGGARVAAPDVLALSQTDGWPWVFCDGETAAGGERFELAQPALASLA